MSGMPQAKELPKEVTSCLIQMKFTNEDTNDAHLLIYTLGTTMKIIRNS